MLIDDFEEECVVLMKDSIDSEIDDLELKKYPESAECLITSEVCFKIANKQETNPSKLSEDITNKMNIDEFEFIDKVENVGPYINFFPSDTWFKKSVNQLSNSEITKWTDIESGEISVEHTSINPTGPVHIGRARNSIIGDFISNLAEVVGKEVTRQYYVNNAGLQVAKMVWGYKTFSEDELTEPDCDKDSCSLVRYYQKADEELDEDKIKKAQKEGLSGSNEQEVIDIQENIEKLDEDTMEIVDNVVKCMLNSQLESFEEIGVSFDDFTFETEYIDSEDMVNMLENMKNSKYCKKIDGAWVIEYEDSEFVIERSNGTTLYSTRDILYQKEKTEKFDDFIIVLGEDQKHHIKNVKYALEKLGNDISGMKDVYHAFVSTPDGGMSARKGTGDFLYEVLDETESKAREEIGDISEDSLAKDIAVGSLRYNLLSKKRSQPVTFNCEKAVSVNSQTGPSIQYSYVRLNGILKNANESDNYSFDPDYIEADEEIEILYKLSEFPLVLENTWSQLEPIKITKYLHELQQIINKFYDKNPVLEAEGQTKQNRLIIVELSKKIMEIGMEITGIPTVSEM